MKTTLLLALLCLYLPYTLVAQEAVQPTYTVKGTVIDSLKNAPASYITVLVQEVGKDQPVKSTFSKDNGTFELSGLPAKQYQLILNGVGYQRKSITLPPFTASTVVDIGSILLSVSTTQLKEVQVTAEKILVTQDIDKIAYNVDADPESQTLTALDMLRKVPLLTVDAEDNISLNGNSNFRVLVNGKTSSLFVRNPKDVFRSMPASSIKSIEVITNPPSKYEAEGVGGIINIITHKKSIGGYNGSINTGLSNPRGGNLGGYLTAKAGKFGFSGYYGYNRYTTPSNPSNLNREDYANGEVVNRLEQLGSSRSNGDFQYFSGELSFELDTMNLFSANYNVNRGSGDNFSTQTIQNFGRGNSLNRAFRRDIDGAYIWSGSDFGADYQHTFKRNKEQLLTLSYKLNAGRNYNYSDFNTQAIQNYTGQANLTENDGDTYEHTVQADYVHPFGKHALEVGGKGIFRISSSDYYYKNLVNEESNLYELVPELSNNFNYRQDIYAAYTTLSLKKDKWGLKMGARLEETKIDANFDSRDSLVRQDYFNLIPNITLSKMLKGTSTMRVSYTQRIERPSLYFLNPYVNVVDTLNISFGNPELDPATNNVFTLAYSTFVKGSSINASLFHNFTNNSIQSYTVLGDDGITRTTYGNIGRNRNYGLSLSGNTTLLKKLSINLNGSLNYMDLEGYINGQLQRNSGFRGNVFGYMSYRFDNGWRAGGNLGFNSPFIMLQGRSAGYVFNSLSLSKQFLKENKATLSASVSNPFQKDRRYFNEVQGQDFYQFQESYFRNRRFNVSFSYRFGKLQGDIARKKRGIKNDDVKAGEQQGGGGAN